MNGNGYIILMTILKERTTSVRTTYNLLVVRYSREEIEQLVVRYGVRPDQFTTELGQSPKHGEISQWQEVEEDRDHEQRNDSQPRQIRHGEVEGAAEETAKVKINDD